MHVHWWIGDLGLPLKDLIEDDKLVFLKDKQSFNFYLN